jgi:hypothetical protein
MLKFIILSIGNLCLFFSANGQYFQDFNETKNNFAENNMPGWATRTGDGEIIFQQRYTGNSVILKIDPHTDIQNIWYAFIHQDISASIDVNQLHSPEYELRMEARVKISHAPRRVNMYLSELDNGGYLREFDIPEADKWHTISMVTDTFIPAKGRPIMTQISLMDWGISDIYCLEVDYIKVDLVNRNGVYPEYGFPLMYRPPIEAPEAFEKAFIVSKSISLDTVWSDLNLNSIRCIEDSIRLLQINPSGFFILTWDFSSLSDQEVAMAGSGQLDLFTYQIIRLSNSPKDFGEIRVCEIYGDKQNWDINLLNYNQFLDDQQLDNRINTQTIMDTKPSELRAAKTTINISKPVIDRLLSGRTIGLAIMPLGYISASFYSDDLSDRAPVLRFHQIK